GAHEIHFGYVGCRRAVASPRVIPRPKPRAGLDHRDPISEMPVMHRGTTYWSKVHTDVASRQGTDRNRRVRRPIGRRARDRQVHAAQFRHHVGGSDVARLALISAHTESRVALQVLHRLVAFLMCECYVTRRHVILEIDEDFALALCAVLCRLCPTLEPSDAL